MKHPPYEKVIFVSKPRCASTSTFEYIYTWDDHTMGSKPLYHIPADNMRAALGSRWEILPTFAIVRNPIDLIVSWYQHHKYGRPSKTTAEKYPDDINDWIDGGFITHWTHWSHSSKRQNPLVQTNWTHKKNTQIVDFLIKLEKQDWTGLERASGLDMSKLPSLNPSPKQLRKDFLKPASVDKIYDYFHTDFKTYEYNTRETI